MTLQKAKKEFPQIPNHLLPTHPFHLPTLLFPSTTPPSTPNPQAHSYASFQKNPKKLPNQISHNNPPQAKTILSLN
jgi:hypothetical protein